MLKQSPPWPIERMLHQLGIAQGDVLLCTDTDVDLTGRYQPQWLIATVNRLLVVSGDGEARIAFDERWEAIAEVRTQAAVGSGLLQARQGERMVDVLRYSNRLAGRFARVARKLDHFIHGEPITIHAAEQCDEPAEQEPSVSKRYVLIRMIRLMAAYRGAAAWMMVLLVAGILLDLAGPHLTRILVDNVLPGDVVAARDLGEHPEAFARSMRMLALIVAVLVGIQLLRMGVTIISNRLTAKVGTALTYDIRHRLVTHLERLSVGYYDKQNVGALVGRVAYDTEALHSFVTQLTSGFLFQLILVVGVGVMMFSINPTLALLVLTPAPLIVLGSTVFWRYIYPRYYSMWDASAKQAAMLSGTLSGVRVVKAFGQEPREVGRFNRNSDYLRRSRLSLDIGSGTFNPIMGIVFQFGGWIVWFVGGRSVLTGTMTLGELMAFFGYLWLFYGPLGSLTQFTNWLTQFVTQANRIFEILDAPVKVADPKQPIAVGTLKGDVTFENVTFGYQKHSPVLRDVSLRIDRGEMVGIVGRSGSGKSTLANLLCRFYDADEGEIRVDGVDVRQMAGEALRGQIGVVLQEPFLFHGSIIENIAYGRPDATPAQIITASKAANCHDFIMHQPHAYDTWVGERGAGLSGGERQRISIARVLLIDPRILILDEATSSVDAESETAIQRGIESLVRNRTTIAIAHRLSTLRHADRILVLDHGRIVESGTHEELVDRAGLYRQLLRMQSGSSENGQAHSNGQHSHEASHARGRAQGNGSGHARYDRNGDADLLVQDAEPANGCEVGSDATDPHPHWLTPDAVRFTAARDGSLSMQERSAGRGTTGGHGRLMNIHALRCLPVHHGERFISIRHTDAQGHDTEVGIIEDLAVWPEAQAKLIRGSLDRRYLIHTIHAIDRARARNGLIHFSVQTDRGPIDFTMRPDTDRAQDFGPSGKMLFDLHDNQYLVPDIDRLPTADRRRLRQHIYW